MVNVLWRSLLQILNEQFGGGVRKRFLTLILLGAYNGILNNFAELVFYRIGMYGSAK